MRFVEAGDHRTAQTTGALLRRTMEQTHRKPGGATDSPHHFVRAVRAVVDEENFGRRGGKALLQPIQERLDVPGLVPGRNDHGEPRCNPRWQLRDHLSATLSGDGFSRYDGIGRIDRLTAFQTREHPRAHCASGHSGPLIAEMKNAAGAHGC